VAGGPNKILVISALQSAGRHVEVMKIVKGENKGAGPAEGGVVAGAEEEPWLLLP
jgi:hypothetical protein